MRTQSTSPFSAPSTAIGPFCGLTNGMLSFCDGRSSTDLIAPPNASSVSATTTSPGAIVSTGGRVWPIDVLVVALFGLRQLMRWRRCARRRRRAGHVRGGEPIRHRRLALWAASADLSGKRLPAVNCDPSFADITTRKQILQRLAHDGRVDINSRPIFDADDALIDHHAEAIQDAAAFGLGVANESRARRVRDDVGHDHGRAQGFDVDRHTAVDVRIEPDRGRIDDDVRLRRDLVVALLNDEIGAGAGRLVEEISERAAAGLAAVHDRDAGRAGECKLDADRPRGAARPEHHDLLAGRIDDLA